MWHTTVELPAGELLGTLPPLLLLLCVCVLMGG